MAMPSKDSKKPEEKENPEKTGPYKTMRVGEAPGEDLGYDPDQIPTEPIMPEEDE